MSKSHDRFDDSIMISSDRISSVYLSRPKFPLRLYSKSKASGSFINYTDSSSSVRIVKRPKNRKISGMQKKDFNKNGSDYTEMAYREAISKLKYLLAETYVPKDTSRIFKPEEDTDDHSIDSEKLKMKNTSSAYSNVALPVTKLQSVPPEITAYIEQQEKYIEQMEQESQYCREELTNLLSKVREVIAENEELHNKTKSKFLKCALEEHENSTEHHCVIKEQNFVRENTLNAKLHKPSKVLEGSNIIFESRIAELEAQLTQAKLELRKIQEENQSNLARLSKGCLNNNHVEMKLQLDEALRAKYDTEIKLEELQNMLSSMRDKEIESSQKTKQLAEIIQQMEFEKNEAKAETRRLKDELDRQHEKFREIAHETSRRIAEEREQVERKYNHKVEQLSADVVSHWDAASKSQLETEKQRRELMELKKELAQKQMFTDNLKKELHDKISSLQSDLNQALTEKDALEQKVLTTKFAAERNERQAKQDQNRLQAEINSYKQRLERADADLVHCRRENLRLMEQITSLEKEINVNKIISSREDSRIQDTQSKQEEKQLNSGITAMEVKHEGPVDGDAATIRNTSLSSNKKRVVKVDLKVKLIPKKKLSSSKEPLSTQ